jgi:long-chain fatty acid transport protein
MFPNDSTTNADMPAMLSVGIDYRIIEPLKISVGYHSYFDKQTQQAKDAQDGGQPVIDRNFFEVGLGLQYDINENFLVSLGYLHANTGVTKDYQSDLDFSLNSNTIGLGGAWKINDMFKLHLGGYYVMYDESTYTYPNPNGAEGTYENSYLKSTFAVSLGLDIAIGKK